MSAFGRKPSGMAVGIEQPEAPLHTAMTAASDLAGPGRPHRLPVAVSGFLALSVLASACASKARSHVDGVTPAARNGTRAPALPAELASPPLSAVADPPREPVRFGSATRARARTSISSAGGLPALPSSATQSYAKWQQRGSIAVGHGYLSVLDISPDERSLLVLSEQEARVRVYDLATLRLVAAHSLSGAGEFVRADVAFFPSAGPSAAFVYASEAGLALHDAVTGEKVGVLDDRGAWQLRFTADGRCLVAALSNLESQTSRLAFYSVTGSRSLILVDELAFSERVDGWDLTSDCQRLAVTLYPSTTVELLDLERSALLWSKPGPQYARDVDIAPNDALLAIGGDHVVLMDVSNGEPRASFDEFDNNVHQVLFSPSGDALAASAYDGKLRLLSPDVASSKLRLLKLFRHGGAANVYALRFFAQGTRLASASGDKTVRIWGD